MYLIILSTHTLLHINHAVYVLSETYSHFYYVIQPSSVWSGDHHWWWERSWHWCQCVCHSVRRLWHNSQSPSGEQVSSSSEITRIWMLGHLHLLCSTLIKLFHCPALVIGPSYDRSQLNSICDWMGSCAWTKTVIFSTLTAQRRGIYFLMQWVKVKEWQLSHVWCDVTVCMHAMICLFIKFYVLLCTGCKCIIFLCLLVLLYAFMYVGFFVNLMWFKDYEIHVCRCFRTWPLLI